MTDTEDKNKEKKETFQDKVRRQQANESPIPLAVIDGELTITDTHTNTTMICYPVSDGDTVTLSNKTGDMARYRIISK